MEKHGFIHLYRGKVWVMYETGPGGTCRLLSAGGRRAGCPREWDSTYDHCNYDIRNRHGLLSVLVKFRQEGTFNAGEFKSLDLGLISKLQISRQRNTSGLLAATPENPRPGTPYMIARRDREYELQAIMSDLQQIRQENKNVTCEISGNEAHLVLTV